MVDEDAEVHPEESGQECQRQEKCGDDRQDVDELTLPVSDIGGAPSLPPTKRCGIPRDSPPKFALV